VGEWFQNAILALYNIYTAPWRHD